MKRQLTTAYLLLSLLSHMSFAGEQSNIVLFFVDDLGSLAVECMDLPAESARFPTCIENKVRESILRDRIVEADHNQNIMSCVRCFQEIARGA